VAHLNEQLILKSTFSEVALVYSDVSPSVLNRRATSLFIVYMVVPPAPSLANAALVSSSLAGAAM
jgi:hypothetical protein